jgi:hypothetical protein
MPAAKAYHALFGRSGPSGGCHDATIGRIGGEAEVEAEPGMTRLTPFGRRMVQVCCDAQRGRQW